MKYIFFLLTTYCFLFITGCSELKNAIGFNDSDSESSVISSQFIVSPATNGISETSYSLDQSIIGTDIQKSYGIGDLKASRNLNFLIGNSGSQIISNITIESNADYLSFTPSFFESLESDQSNFELFEVGIEHGIAINGIGYVDILQMGEHTPTFIVTGTTTNENGEQVTIKSIYQLTFNAKVAAFELIIGGVTKDMSVGDSSGQSPYGGINNAKYFYSNNQSVKLHNSGNIDLTINLKEHFAQLRTFSTFTIPIGESITINTPLSPYNQWVEVDGNNAVFDFDIYDVGNNGKAYFELLDQATP